MDDYLSEKEQMERIRQWISENGRSVLTGLLLGIAALVGWRQWVDYRENKLADASNVYTELLAAVDAGERDRALELAGTLDEEYGRTPYSIQASLLLARMYMEMDEPENAAKALQTVIDEARDEELVQIARVRLARVRLYQQQADVALETLGDHDPGKFAPLYHEARGDALVALGRTDEAREAYEQALATLEPGIADPTLIEMKLSDVASAAGAGQDATNDAGS